MGVSYFIRELEFGVLYYLWSQNVNGEKKFKCHPLWNFQALPVDLICLPSEKRVPDLESDPGFKINLCDLKTVFPNPLSASFSSSVKVEE